ncbi:MAG: hypothetical protein WBP59_02630 [Ilumatobacteraceae bacterium]
MTRALAGVALIAVLAGACGGGGDTTTDVVDPPAVGETNATVVSDEAGSAASSGEEASNFDTATMPPAGVITVEVDGRTFEFAQADVGVMNFDCEVDAERVELDYQSQDNSTAIHVEYSDQARIGGDAGTWGGNATIDPSDLDEGQAYRSSGEPLTGSSIVVAPPHVMVTTGVRRFDAPSDIDGDDVGTAIIRATCGDGGG